MIRKETPTHVNRMIPGIVQLYVVIRKSHLAMGQPLIDAHVTVIAEGMGSIGGPQAGPSQTPFSVDASNGQIRQLSTPSVRASQRVVSRAATPCSRQATGKAIQTGRAFSAQAAG